MPAGCYIPEPAPFSLSHDHHNINSACTTLMKHGDDVFDIMPLLSLWSNQKTAALDLWPGRLQYNLELYCHTLGIFLTNVQWHAFIMNEIWLTWVHTLKIDYYLLARHKLHRTLDSCWRIEGNWTVCTSSEPSHVVCAHKSWSIFLATAIAHAPYTSSSSCVQGQWSSVEGIHFCVPH